MATHARSVSNINPRLAIERARADGFHGPTTMYQTLALHDVVTARNVDRADMETSQDSAG